MGREEAWVAGERKTVDRKVSRRNYAHPIGHEDKGSQQVQGMAGRRNRFSLLSEEEAEDRDDKMEDEIHQSGLI